MTTNFEEELPDEIGSLSTMVLALPEIVRDILREAEIDTLSHLYVKVVDGSICEVSGIGERRREQLAEELNKFALSRRRGAIGLVFSWSTVMYYVLVGAVITVIMLCTYKDAFDNDEYAVLAGALFSGLAFDAGRWASRPRITSIPFEELHIRNAVVFLSVCLTLLFATKEPWVLKQESLRVILCGVSLAGISGLVALFHGRLVAVKLQRPGVPSAPRAEIEKESTLASLGRWFKSLDPNVQAIIATSTFGLLTGVGTFAANTIHRILLE